MNSGKIFVISGPSGVGKGTIAEEIRKYFNFYWAKSYTTRPERESDKLENHYFFVDEASFKKFEHSGEILESNYYNGNWYGSSKNEIDKAISDGKNILKEIEVNGGMVYKEKYPNAVLIFIKAPLENIKSRLVKRGQNSDDQIEERLKIAEKELSFEKEYNYSVINPEGHPEKAIDEIKKIIQDELRN